VQVVVGLGNPGFRYANTRHNVGFMVLDRLARELGLRWVHQQRYPALLAEGTLATEKILLVKPLLFINLSGGPVRAVVSPYGLSIPDMIFVHDDLDLPLGRLRIRGRGSAGGHRGFLSLINELGTQELRRLKVGIGRPPGDDDAVDHVLSSFCRQEWEVMQTVLPRAVDAVKTMILEGLETAMNRYNVAAEEV